MYYVGKIFDSLYLVLVFGRIVVIVWWFVIGIFFLVYIVNLVVFFILKRFSFLISSMEDFVGQEFILYGIVSNSQLQVFFELFFIFVFVIMWQYMKYYYIFVVSSDEGISKVKRGNFVFIWDFIVLEYLVYFVEFCGFLIIIGKLFGKIGYGIGLFKGFKYIKELS